MPLPLRATNSLSGVARTSTLRIDAKQAARSSIDLDVMLDGVPTFVLNEVLPQTFVKGKQPEYLDDFADEGALVVNTGAVQPLGITFGLCRRIATDGYERLDEARKLRDGDVLLTTDGGTSIGKAAVFSRPQDGSTIYADCGFTVDSHVAILRPFGLSPTTLAYLLCSPMGQIQFQRAESGASGQTAVSEEDVRRFRFPRLSTEALEEASAVFQAALSEVRALEKQAQDRRLDAWEVFQSSLIQTPGSQLKIAARVRPSERRRREAITH